MRTKDTELGTTCYSLAGRLEDRIWNGRHWVLLAGYAYYLQASQARPVTAWPIRIRCLMDRVYLEEASYTSFNSLLEYLNTCFGICKARLWNTWSYMLVHYQTIVASLGFCGGLGLRVAGLFRLGVFLSLAHPRARVAAFFIRTHSQRETSHGFAYCESSSERWVGSPTG